MSTRCKHGVPGFCARCQEETERQPLSSDAIRYTGNGQPVLVLRVYPDSTRAKVLRLDPESPTATLDLVDLRADESSTISHRLALIERFHALALDKGYLYHPVRPLTTREQTEEGPSHCYYCKSEVSFEKGSLGCTQCQYNVCSCGRCLCGYEGRNYLGEWFTQYPQLPIEREDRLEFVRAVTYCAGGAKQQT